MSNLNVWKAKPWGRTKLLYRSDRSGTHIIEINPYGYCSCHKHNNLSNAFYVVTGKLEIVVWEKNQDARIHILGPDEYLSVPRGIYHRFINHELPTKCLELYETPIHDGDDIERLDEGGPDYIKFGADKLRRSPFEEPKFYGEVAKLPDHRDYLFSH